MNKQILINITPQETRAAIVENDVLQEVCIERSANQSKVGNIYNGKVTRVLPGMEAAFVSIGLDKAGFLHVSDIDKSTHYNTPERPPINQLIREGQSLRVQITKDPMNNKGARLTTELSMSSRYIVYLANASFIGISAKIENPAERERLQQLLAKCLNNDPHGGYIARTAAIGVSEDALHRDIDFLSQVWDKFTDSAPSAKPETLIHQELPLSLRTLRDMADENTRVVSVDSKQTYQQMIEFSTSYMSNLSKKIEHYQQQRPLFDLYNIEDDIQRALARQVPLKSGGHLTIDQTEAMTTIDINTGTFVGNQNLEDTSFKSNIEASEAIARQLRLRNLGGIIIIDFIDMLDQAHQRQVLESLKKHLRKDHAKTQVFDISPLGLVEMTRERTRESLAHILSETCQTCHGCGTHKTIETVCHEILRKVLQEASIYKKAQALLIIANQNVIDRLRDQQATSLAALETFVERPVKLQIEAHFSQETYNVVPI